MAEPDPFDQWADDQYYLDQARELGVTDEPPIDFPTWLGFLHRHAAKRARLDRAGLLARMLRTAAVLPVERPRERRSQHGRSHSMRSSPSDDSAPADSDVNIAWQAALDSLSADWQFRHIARLCLIRARWLRRWWNK